MGGTGEQPDWQALMHALLDAPDDEAAERFADAHLEIHDPAIVEAFVRAGRDNAGGDDSVAQRNRSRASLLCGRAWSEGPDIVAAVSATARQLEAEPSDLGLAAAGIVATRPIIGLGDAAGYVHPHLLALTCDVSSRALATVYRASGDIQVLQEAIAIQRRALDLLPAGAADRHILLSNLANRVADLYAVTTERALLDESIAAQREAIDVAPAGAPERAELVSNLASYLSDLYRATADRGILDEVVALQRTTVATLSLDDERAAIALDNLGSHLAELYEVTGERELLDGSVVRHRQAVKTTRATGSDLPRHLDHLASRLSQLYAASNNVAHLTEAVRIQRQAVAATPPNGAERSGHLNDLANLLSGMYRAIGDRAALDEALAVQRGVVESTLPSNVDYAGSLTNLASRLVEHYHVTGNRSFLEDALQVQANAVRATPETNSEFALHLNGLAARHAELHAATGELGWLVEAVAVQRRAIAATPADSPHRPHRLSNLGNYLLALYRATSERAMLDEAIVTMRESVASTLPASTELPRHLSNLADHLEALHAATGDTTALDEAIALQRRAVNASSFENTEQSTFVTNLAVWLTTLFAVTGRPGALEEAWSVVEHVEGRGPAGRLRTARTRARIAGLRGDHRRVAHELEVALGAFDDEVARLRSLGDVVMLRDLAQQVDGLLGDLAAALATSGDIARAVTVLESDRTWLPAPAQERAAGAPSTPVPVAWVVPSQQQTVVITASGGGAEAHVVGLTNGEIGRAVEALVNAVRSADTTAIHVATAHAVALTSRLAATFPVGPRLLVIPLGTAALLPYAAAHAADGRPLVEQTAITLAPSLAWARAAHRSRPNPGGYVGAFHPGDPSEPDHMLDLRRDRAAFERYVGPNALDSPSADAVLAALRPDTAIGHFSCHASYDVLSPFESALQLGTSLTLHAVLGHRPAPWLVNLAACETGVSDMRASEQSVSFPTGFLLGGAAHVFATLWPVDDAHTSLVVEEAYRRLASGSHPAEALRDAVRTLRSALASHAGTPGAGALDGPHPTWWSAFTHYGSPW